MTRRMLCTALAGIALSLIASQSAFAGEFFRHGGGSCPNGLCPSTTSPVTNAGMYPMPVQNVPPGLGGTYITNPAFYPHEYLYAHQHRYLAPPFYHVRGGLFGFLHKSRSNNGCCEDACPRCGSGDCKGNCKIRGTEIIVKYKTKRSWFRTHFISPR